MAQAEGGPSSADHEQETVENPREMAQLLNSSSSTTLRSNGSQLIVERGPKCLLCHETITVPQERFKPCSCGNIYTHTFCALNDEKWLSRKCVSCGAGLRPPMNIPSSSSSSRTHVNNHSRTKCYICGATSPSPKSGFRSDLAMIRPCFCDVSCHHQCIAARVTTERRCKVCGVQYRYREYGSLWDFFMRYRYQYCCTVSVLLFLFSISAFAIIKSITKVERFSVARLILLLIGVVIFGSCLVFMWMCIKYTIMRRIPRFTTRYRQITVFNYEPSETSKPQIRIQPSDEKSQTVSLLGVDNTLEQCLTSCEIRPPSTWHASSTPIVEGSQLVAFSFDTPLDEKKQRK
ncbi:hypothetical protein V3C99_011758 [Haemonchus contortus]